MTSHVHEFDAREGGAFRVSLTYNAPTATGKTAAHTDTYHGRFVRLVPNELVVELLEFETSDPALRGEMTMTTTLADANGGTDVVVVHEGIPSGVPAADNETGTRMALANLAAFVESGKERLARGRVRLRVRPDHPVSWAGPPSDGGPSTAVNDSPDMTASAAHEARDGAAR